MKQFLFIGSLIILVITLFIVESTAQCPMCKMAAESNLKDGGAAGKGLNTGILYLLAMPYLLVLTFIILWRKSRKKILQ